MNGNIATVRKWSPVVIIGAPRSGTNMLRDVLTRLPGLETWPCDEINYIWRHGNKRFPSDEFSTEQSSTPIKQYIRRQFNWVAHNYNAHTVVEKTCANSLRVEFVDQILPEARYIFIRRDGLDAVASAMKRWKAELDISYLASKVRFVPVSDLPYYAALYLWNRCYRLWSRQGRLAFWGPKLNDMDKLLTIHSIEEVCALQWKRCVDAAAKAFSSMPNDRWMEVGYEDFVRDPDKKLHRLVEFLGLKIDDELCRKAVKTVTPQSIGKGRSSLGKKNIQRLMPLIKDTMINYGYI
ncbi:sulfotransferase [Thermodesulfobacteriota bacterium]